MEAHLLPHQMPLCTLFSAQQKRAIMAHPRFGPFFLSTRLGPSHHQGRYGPRHDVWTNQLYELLTIRPDPLTAELMMQDNPGLLDHLLEPTTRYPPATVSLAIMHLCFTNTPGIAALVAMYAAPGVIENCRDEFGRRPVHYVFLNALDEDFSCSGADIRGLLLVSPGMMLGPLGDMRIALRDPDMNVRPPLGSAAIGDVPESLFFFMCLALMSGINGLNLAYSPFHPMEYLGSESSNGVFGRILKGSPRYHASAETLIRLALPSVRSLQMEDLPLQGPLLFLLPVILKGSPFLIALTICNDNTDDEEYDCGAPTKIPILPDSPELRAHGEIGEVGYTQVHDKPRHLACQQMLRDGLALEENALQCLVLGSVPPIMGSSYMATFNEILTANFSLIQFAIVTTRGLDITEETGDDVDPSDAIRRDQVAYKLALNRNGRHTTRSTSDLVPFCLCLDEVCNTQGPDTDKWKDLAYGLLRENPSAWNPCERNHPHVRTAERCPTVLDGKRKSCQISN